MIRACLISFALAAPAAATALDLPPVAERTATERDASGVAALPAGSWRAGDLERRRFEGDVTRSAWRLPGDDSAAALIGRLTGQMDAAGFEIVHRCRDRVCGGFDFRFALDLLGAPAMYVDLGAYHYALGARPDGAAVALVTSDAPDAVYLHVTDVAPAGPGGAARVRATTMGRGAADAHAAGLADPGGAGRQPSGTIADALLRDGRAVLGDLSFAVGTTSLSPGDYGSLADLAAFLRENPARRLAVVGHTDTAGTREVNAALSRRRAEAVRERLIQAHGIASGRLDVEGAAYLAPVASNATDAGRRANRRVEAVLLD